MPTRCALADTAAHKRKDKCRRRLTGGVISPLSRDEARQMKEQTASSRDIDRPAPAGSVIEAFERQVDIDPRRDAIRSLAAPAAGQVSFGELDAWANAIASELIRRRGSKPEPVALAVCAPALMLAAALGALKAGKFYAAVNPLHPARHVQRVLDELDAPLVLCDLRGRIAARTGRVTVSVEEIVQARTHEERPGLRFDERQLAYVLYTSGSTGRPRGVAQSRHDMLHNVERHRPLAIGAGDCTTLISADGFVSSISNPYVALLGGSALAPYSFKDRGVEELAAWLQGSAVTVLYSFPSFLRQLAATPGARAYAGLRLAYLGGETVLAADLAAARRLFPAAALSVGLNSSETGLTCLHVLAPRSPIPDPVPVGRAVLDIEIAIVDERGAALASGASGEIEIRSEHVCPRYWERGGLRDDRHTWTGFRTGDRGRRDADGVVYHLGRVDQMVKIRGFRVETGELEATISALAGVAEVAVFGLGREPNTQLAACIVASTRDIDPISIRGAVAAALPSAMVPTRIAIVDALPRTTNGKLDRARLASLVERRRGNREEPDAWSTIPVEPAASSNGWAAPGSEPQPHRALRREVERRVAGIWRAELELDRVTPEGDFFTLGGTSLSAVSVISRVRTEFGVHVPLAILFRSPTVRALSAAVLELRDTPAIDDPQQPRGVLVRPARERDLTDVCALVNHYVAHTSFNFRTEPHELEEWIADWSATSARYPWLTAHLDGALVGIAYAAPWKGRAAYDWCAEVTVYVAHDRRRVGVGRALYRRLLPILDAQGYRTQLAAIALPNAPSVALHETCGFRHRGTLDGVGYKQGSWLDVGFWQRGEPRRGAAPGPLGAVPGE
jgi:acyl-coenzyme A synthetase/AMP-(fatty) acid ligase/L-amino acid N-acyltransferase YncA/acyl carrier protein